MKKSFMTRVLATGLSLAMAFSLSAATNVSVASAAAKPAMKSSKMTVKVGQKKNYQATAATQKAYKITKVKMSAAGKTKAKVTVNSSKKSIKVEGLAATKGSNVVISFKNNKTKKTTKVTTKVVVKAVEEAKGIVSATQTGVKAITVTTNFDASQSKVTLSKGAASVEIASSTVSSDGKSIVISTTANLVAATYTVKVDDFSKDVVAETSKIDEIKILSDKAAVADKDDTGKYMGATVGYQVLNQFKDDITKTVSLTANSSASTTTLNPSAHLIKFTTTAPTGFMLGRDIIVVSLLDTTGGKNVTATLTLSTEAYAADITFEGVYNIDGKTLTEDTNFDNDPFYMLFSAKDQYGNKFNNYKSITENDDLYVTVIGGLTALTKEDTGKSFIVLNKDGVDYLAYPLGWMPSMNHSVGTATVQVLSAGGGSCTGEIEVGTGARVDSITVAQNGVVVAGEENELSFTALDANGKEVTAYKQLKDITINGNDTKHKLAFERNADGSAKLILDISGVDVAKGATAMHSFTFETLNHKFSTALITISENARPVAIDGLRDVPTSVSTKTSKIDIKLKNLKIEDQYGRILTEKQVADMTDNTGIYKLSKVTASVVTNGVIKVSGGGVTASPNLVTGSAINNTSTAKNDVIFQIIPNAKGTDVVTFQIYNGGSGDDQLADASVNVNYVVKDTTAATVATATVDSVYVATGAAVVATVGAAYAQPVKVKVGGALLANSDYTVEVPGDMTVTTATVDNTDVHAVYSTKGQDEILEFKNKTATTLTRTLTITLNGTGEKFTVDVTLDSTAPKISTVVGLKDKFKPGNNDTINAAYLLNSASGKLKGWDRIADQYGKVATVSTSTGEFTLADGTKFTPSLTFEPAVALEQGDGAPTSLTNNNKSDASMKVNTGFAGAGLEINFGGIKSNVKILGF